MQQAEYLKERVDNQINWMETKSAYNQKKYKQFKVAEIVVAAAIPFLAGLQTQVPEVAIVTGLLGVVVVILSGLQQLYKYHENWLTYRSAIEELKREKILFETQTGRYTGNDAFALFVESFEALLGSENKVWKENAGKQEKQDKQHG